MKKILLALVLSTGLAGCATLQTAINDAKNVYTFATTKTVPATQVAIVANAFDAIKATAVNYANYCVLEKFPQPICSAANRRAVIKSVNAGTAARIQLEVPINTGQPAAATIYNALVAAVQSLQASPINTVASPS